MATASTPEKRAAFLEALSLSGSVTQAADAVGVDRTTPYKWRKADERFAAEWEAAFALGIDALEAELIRRAFAGSDTAAIFLLKGNKPEKYKDRLAAEHSGPNGQPIAVDDASAADKLAAILSAAASRKASGEDLA